MNYFKNTLATVLGRDLPVLSEMVPILRKLFENDKSQENRGDVAPSEAEDRILRVVRNFLDCVALDDRPLVLFIDDLQWCSSAEVTLLTQLIATFPAQDLYAVRNVLFLIAYRTNELQELTKGKLDYTRQQLKEMGAGQIMHEIQINPLLLVFPWVYSR